MQNDRKKRLFIISQRNLAIKRIAIDALYLQVSDTLFTDS